MEAHYPIGIVLEDDRGPADLTKKIEELEKENAILKEKIALMQQNGLEKAETRLEQMEYLTDPVSPE